MPIFNGLSDERKHYSRFSKPQENTHDNIFGKSNAQLSHTSSVRPQYNQQNSPNVSGVMGTIDANELLNKKSDAIAKQLGTLPNQISNEAGVNVSQQASGEHSSTPVVQKPASQRRHVPPGGYSKGLW